jgi:hypothetical protein
MEPVANSFAGIIGICLRFFQRDGTTAEYCAYIDRDLGERLIAV